MLFLKSTFLSGILLVFLSLLSVGNSATKGNGEDDGTVDAEKYMKWLVKISAMDFSMPQEEVDFLREVLVWLDEKAFTEREIMEKMLDGIIVDCDVLDENSNVTCDEASVLASEEVFGDWEERRNQRLLQRGGVSTDGSLSTFGGDGILSSVDNSSEIPEVLGYATYANSLEYPDQDVSTMMKRLDGPLPGPLLPEGRKISRILARETRSQLAFATTFVAEDTEEFFSAFFSPATIGRFRIPNPAVLLPEPEVTTIWEEDLEFGRQFIAGVNPLSIRRCLDPAVEMTIQTTAFLEGQGIDISAAVDDNLLYYASYDELASLASNPHDTRPPAYYNESSPQISFAFHPAMVVFLLGDGGLNPVSIQLGYDDEARVFSRSTASDEEWLVAKMAVQNADGQIHESLHHLGLTHFVMEPHVLAIHNVLRRNGHPLWDLLLPIVRDTLALNVIGRDTAFAYRRGATLTTDELMSIGSGQVYQLIRDSWLRYNFFDSAFDRELESRGFPLEFDGLPNYYYKEDGGKLWAAYGQFVSDFVDEVYPTDFDVAADPILQDWASETTDPSRAGVPGFPEEFQDKATLSSALQVLMWLAGGRHSAVNFPQFDYYGFTPNKPLGLEGGMTDFLSNGATSANPRGYIFSDTMPGLVTTTGIMGVLFLLSTPTDYTIDGLSDHFVSTAFGNESYANFLIVLQSLSLEIDARNDELAREGKPTYPYLNPSFVPASIDI